MKKLIALLSGTLFGMGLTYSGMVDPKKVIGFLDLFGNWDPSLAFVMVGALLVFIPGYFFIIKKSAHPVCNSEYGLPTNKVIDKNLIIGAALFGIGWGLGGLCPGPAVASLGSLNQDLMMFVVMMFIGIKAGQGIKSKS